jgi:hypothetical protein
MHSQCIVVNESVSREEIGYIAYERRWSFSEAIADSDGATREVIYKTKITKSCIHYMIEKVQNLPYLVVEGESIEPAIKDISASLPIHSREDILRMIQSPKDQEEYLKGVLYLGLQGKFKECDSETLEIFEQILQNEDPKIRTTAITAMSYAGWSEFQDLVKPLMKDDPDIDVRETATHFLEGKELT